MALRIYGNRVLKTLSGQATRPTPSKVRQALFNIWQGDIEGCCWLDLCAGSGAMGAEALCRGAKTVVGIEQSAVACRVIRENWQRVAKEDQSFFLIRGDVAKQLKRLQLASRHPSAPQRFDRIYFDPPYTSDLYIPVLCQVGEFQLLASGGELAVEHQPNYWQAEDISGLRIIRQKHYGKTHLTFYTQDDSSETSSSSGNTQTL
ncbi:Putative rRNA methyltransferase YlbH [Halomicronema hongdechloris C2206]|uniref:rRNA methyltransferase YlbH n=1 Tax=Halomicronema hongdechloris C2206 TaxID=1641165 RepID=A0A1V8NN55_9CYAN|nr:16S rRNA (guanine(966)-N(2))-methyltransferase RsmD [Halomicronema hongdechloris]ASC72209.1 Putative rRNA methyltransferase YlbH [Halomicronema hongdechloris C2206]